MLPPGSRRQHRVFIGTSLAAKGIAAGGQDMGMMAEAIEHYALQFHD
jgi:hypothetical protein